MNPYIKIIDNFIPPDYQEGIKSMLFGKDFSWYYSPDVTFEELGDRKGSPSHSHTFRSNGTTFSSAYHFISPMAFYATAMAGIKFHDILQARTFLQFPLSSTFNTDTVDPPHVDMLLDHLVCLYYVVDSDGDTIITNKRSEDDHTDPAKRITSFTDADILQKVTPKQGTAVLFDGRLYHTAEQPKNNIRCVINMDIV
jgi:hypothetical protein